NSNGADVGSKYDEGVSRIVDLINSNGADVGSKYDEGVSRIVDLINSKNNVISNQIAIVNDSLLKNSSNIDSNLSILVNAYKEHYNEIRKYFFNGYESTLKQFMNTDFLFNLCYYNNIKFLSYSPEENRMLLETEEGIILSTNNHIWTIMEINGLNEYVIPQLYQFEDFVVFDIGMNRAYASLKFANFDNCSHVYGFEIDEFTYERAVDNINFNPSLASKIKPYNFGLSDKDEFVDLYYLDGYDGLNTMISEFTNIQPSLRVFKDNLKVKSVEVKNTTDVISKIIKSDNIDSNIVLKIDTEGAEYKIINDLIESGLINKMDVILGEGHMFSDEDFKDKLNNLGFCEIKWDIESFTYSFAYVKQEYYNFWPNIPLM
ncbi:FkbM family methyltransferase, partial [Methanobrevibacter sp.]|uniref:FkbM family methyltransferase n=1 Tax=Methanobrevibacter sp. TaxID=66852 RepID=UPI0025F46F74